MVFARMPVLARRVVAALLGVGLAMLAAWGLGSSGGGGLARHVGADRAADRPATRLAAAIPFARSLRLFYTPPVLVRAGEQVVMPVDAVCATAAGTPCHATVEAGVQTGADPWRSVRAAATASLRFDLTASARRAASSKSRVVRFYLRAVDRGGKVSELGGKGFESALRIYVPDRMPTVVLPAIPFGQTRAGTVVLSLPWGTGPLRAGLELGNESDTVGPASFDVDGEGRLYVLDTMQQRLALFENGRLTRSVRLSEGFLFDVAEAGDGSAYVLSRIGGDMFVRHLDPEGAVGAASHLGPGIPSQVRMEGRLAVAGLLPLDGWVRVPPPGRSLTPSPPIHTGRPLASGQELLRVARPDSIRLAMVSRGLATRAVELRSTLRLGEVSLAEPDGAGGYWVVVHVSRDGPTPADQYEMAHVKGAVVLAAFGVPNRSFANTPPLNRFRLVGRFLYQMTSSSSGMQIVRYDLEEE